MSSLRTLQVTTFLAPRWGGPAVAAVESNRALCALGVDAHLIGTSWGLDADEQARLEGLGVLCSPVQWHGRHFGLSLDLMRAVRRRVPEVDLVHVHGLHQWSAICAEWLARHYGVPYVVQAHGKLEPVDRARRAGRKRLFDETIGRYTLARSGGVVVATAREARRAREVLPRDVPTYVVPLGGEIASEGTGLAAGPAVPAPGSYVLFLGRLVAHKGVFDLVRTWEVLRDECAVLGVEPPPLVMAGPADDSTEQAVREAVRGAGLGRYITLRGLVTGDRKRDLLRGARACILLSRNENFSVVTAEAAVLGTPSVLSAGVALGEELEGTSAAIVVRASAGPALWREAAVAVRRLWDESPEAAAERRRATSALASQRFTWSGTARRLVEVYETTVGLDGPDG
jgi:glycosyltransferase involved in cell wall biosynthesis